MSFFTLLPVEIVTEIFSYPLLVSDFLSFTLVAKEERKKAYLCVKIILADHNTQLSCRQVNRMISVQAIYAPIVVKQHVNFGAVAQHPTLLHACFELGDVIHPYAKILDFCQNLNKSNYNYTFTHQQECITILPSIIRINYPDSKLLAVLSRVLEFKSYHGPDIIHSLRTCQHLTSVKFTVDHNWYCFRFKRSNITSLLSNTNITDYDWLDLDLHYSGAIHRRIIAILDWIDEYNISVLHLKSFFPIPVERINHRFLQKFKLETIRILVDRYITPSFTLPKLSSCRRIQVIGDYTLPLECFDKEDRDKISTTSQSN